MTQFFAFIATWASLIGGIWLLFNARSQVVKPQDRLATARWLRSAESSQIIAGFPDTFVRMFDRVFGEKHLSIQCFLRSCIASFFGFWLLLAILYLANSDYFMAGFAEDPNVSLPISLLVFSLSGGVINFIPDS